MEETYVRQQHFLYPQEDEPDDSYSGHGLPYIPDDDFEISLASVLEAKEMLEKQVNEIYKN